MRKVACVFVLAFLALAVTAQDKSSDLKFTVLKADNGKPVRNASVVLHPVNKEGRQEKGGYELKTNSEGVTSFPGAPYGALRVQVLARGFQTFGQDYTIDEPKKEIVIKLERPQPQYSIYGNKKPDEDKKPKE